LKTRYINGLAKKVNPKPRIRNRDKIISDQSKTHKRRNLGGGEENTNAKLSRLISITSVEALTRSLSWHRKPL
jgi:hypothetical protein